MKPRPWMVSARLMSWIAMRRTVSSIGRWPRPLRARTSRLGPSRSVTSIAHSFHRAPGVGVDARETRGETGAETVKEAVSGTVTIDQPRKLRRVRRQSGSVSVERL